MVGIFLDNNQGNF